MRISTKVQYGLRAMAYLAQNAQDGRAVSVREVSYKEKIPNDYLEKIFVNLQKAGLLAAKKGVAGGYIMAHSANEIKIAQIFDALESRATKIKCIDARCAREESCLTKILWCKMQAAINDFLESITLADLIDKKL